MIAGIEDLLKKQAVVLKHDEATTVRQFKNKLNEVEEQVNLSGGKGLGSSGEK